jgi:hypothetical protein
LESELLVRTFNQRVAGERQTIERLNKLKQSINDLRRFLKEIGRLPPDPLTAWIIPPNEEITKAHGSLNFLQAMESLRRQIGTETMLRYGVTRKSGITNKQAAVTAAIGWIAHAVKRIAGKPLTHHAAVLAEASLNIIDVTNHRTRAALRTSEKLHLNSHLKEKPGGRSRGNWFVRPKETR